MREFRPTLGGIVMVWIALFTIAVIIQDWVIRLG